jgi:hypothetical protein
MDFFGRLFRAWRSLITLLLFVPANQIIERGFWDSKLRIASDGSNFPGLPFSVKSLPSWREDILVAAKPNPIFSGDCDSLLLALADVVALVLCDIGKKLEDNK